MQKSSEERKKVCIGIPCFQGVTFEVLDDYMRFAFHLGRRNQQYDFFLAIKGKSEQFRARNAIVESAIAVNADYLLMLDDDHVVDVERHLTANDSYEFLNKLITHLEEDPKKGIVGALYFQRGASCDPVIMFKNSPGYTFYTMNDVSRRLQKVDVTGGGCMCINMKVFDKINSPWFQPELGQGTDIQLCEKVANAGWEIWCDTSIELGHIMTDRMVVTSKNANHIRLEASEWMNREDIKKAPALRTETYIKDYDRDILEYTQKSQEQLMDMRLEYDRIFSDKFDINNLEEYYKDIGEHQLARNYCYHMVDSVVQYGRFILQLFNPNIEARGLDFCCGTAPLGFELAIRGHVVDLVDVPGSAAENFLKWRCKKYDLEKRCGFTLKEDYDWILLMDAIEHLHPDKAEDIIVDLIKKLKPGGSIITNYWVTLDFENHEHVFMKHRQVRKIFEREGMFNMPILVGANKIDDTRWVKSG